MFAVVSFSFLCSILLLIDRHFVFKLAIVLSVLQNMAIVLSVLQNMAIVLSVLQNMASDHPIGILKLS